MQNRVLNKVNLEETEEEGVHGNRVDGEAGGGDDVGADHDQQDWDEAGERDREMSSRMNKTMREGMKMKDVRFVLPSQPWE